MAPGTFEGQEDLPDTANPKDALMSMRRTLATATLTALLAMTLMPAAHADSGHADGLEYDYDPSDVAAGATVTGFVEGSETSTLIIPSEVELEGVIYDVTAVGEKAFNGYFVTSFLTSVTIPGSVTYIGDTAFKNNNLTSLNLGEGLEWIGLGAFGENELSEIELPDSIEHIGGGSFENNQLAELALPHGLERVDHSAFKGNELTQVTIPDSVVYLGARSFSSNSLAQLEIPQSVTLSLIHI